ncbi:MAG: M48 family metallopeptidase [Marinifilaceae bacterium]
MRSIRKQLQKLAIVSLLFFAVGCATVPITGRKQMNLFPEGQMISMSLTQYDQFLKENKVSEDKEQTQLVKNVGHRIAEAVEQYMNEKGLGDRIANFQWEFNLVESDVPNAWCMPGGKVVFYSGILPYTKTEAGLAVVMGHEIAHAIARHGNERMSQQMGIQAVGMGLNLALQEKPKETQNIAMAAFGGVSNLGVILPFSRTHETEADKMGLIFMAMAGYDPAEAVEFWKRMADSGGQKPPEFLSTHPSDETRIQNLKAFLPEAMKYYKKK